MHEAPQLAGWRRALLKTGRLCLTRGHSLQAILLESNIHVSNTTERFPVLAATGTRFHLAGGQQYLYATSDNRLLEACEVPGMTHGRLGCLRAGLSYDAHFF